MIQRLSLAFLSVMSIWMMTAAGSAQSVRTLRVNIESTPAGAAVYVDSRQTASLGRTPLRNVSVPRGQHTLLFVLDNHETSQMPVNVTRARETFRATLQALSRLVINSANEGAQGASVFVDGVQRGGLPLDLVLQPGRHQLRVIREGYNTLEQWVDLQPAQALTIPVALERLAPRTGAISVAGDVQGARVTVDNQVRGSTPTIVDGLSEGEHTVEVRMEGEQYRPFLQTVRVIAGQTTLVNPQLRVEMQQTGSLRVISNISSAMVSIDGEPPVASPASREGLIPGEHLVVVTAQGHISSEQTVVIEAGRQRILSVQLQPQPQAPGRIVVNVNVDGSTVFIDGQERGAPPIVIENATVGTHAIIVRAQGYQELRHTCQVAAGQDCELNAQLVARQVRIRVSSNVATARLNIDENDLGAVPYEGQLSIGPHRIVVSAEGYRSQTEQISLDETTGSRDINVTLISLEELTAEERAEENAIRQRSIDRAMLHTGAILPVEMAVLDMSIGWPYLGELRLGIGLHEYLEFDLGVRSFGSLTEFEGRFRTGWQPRRQISLGAEARLGGGIGPTRGAAANEADTGDIAHPTNNIFASIQGTLSIHFSGSGALSLFAAFDAYGDRWDFTGADRNIAVTNQTREWIPRFRFGGNIDVVMSDRWNFWMQVEGAVGKERRIVGNMFGTGLNVADTMFYGRLGLTYKFPTPIGGF